MKIKLLTGGGFGGLGAVSFPVEVEAEHFPESVMWCERYGIAYSELIRIGADAKYFSNDTLWWWFPSEVEVVE